MPSRILIGTASWSDPEFVRDWYPRGLAPQQRLGFYAGQFEMVELNSSFYGIPEARQVEQWIRATPADFIFNVKLHKLLSRHSCEKKLLPADLQKLAKTTSAGRVILTPEMEAAAAERCLRAVEPFERAGKLGVLLLQLSPAFSPRNNRLGELEGLLALLAPRSVAVEPRNRHWVEGGQLQETMEFFGRHRVTLVSVDAPDSENFNVMPAVDAATNPAVAYLRLHGRNARGYLTGKSVAERFDHDYSETELEEIHGRVERLAARAEQVHVVFNNNRSDFAPKNAAHFREMLGQRA